MRAIELDREAAAKVAAAIENGEPPDPGPNPRAAPLDPIRIRGLPAFRSGWPAAVAGSDPVRELLAKERRQKRA
jgi:hypothetical protein